ncbi:MAG: helix-turn-helix domain-containing protein [Dehalococcoidia bacterium]
MVATYVRSESANGQWDMVVESPDPRLRAHVREYEWWTETSPTPQRSRHVPFGNAVMIINLGPPLGVEYPARGEDFGRLQAFFAGLHDGYAITDSPGHSRGLQINLTPIGARLFLDAPMSELTNRAVELREVIGPLAGRVAERLHDAPTSQACFAILDDAIGARIAAARPVLPAVVWAWQQIVSNHGCVSIGGLAGEIGWSRKHLTAQFREHIGLPPKTLARIHRFDRARRLLERAGTRRWAEIALRCGYYDQAHFIRDFSAFSGVTPRAFVRSLLPHGDTDA